MTVYFVRHGEVENPEQIRYGRLPGFPLTEKGRQEIRETAGQLESAGIQAIFTSPLLRTKQSAQILSECLGLPVNCDDRLLEHDHGIYTGAKIEDYKANKYWKYGGESLGDCGNRVLDFLEEVKGRSHYQTIAVVSHGGPIAMAILNRAGRTEEDYDSISLPMGGYLKYEI